MDDIIVIETRQKWILEFRNRQESPSNSYIENLKIFFNNLKGYFFECKIKKTTLGKIRQENLIHPVRRFGKAEKGCHFLYPIPATQPQFLITGEE